MTAAAWLESMDLSVASAQGLDVSNYQGKFDWKDTTGLSFGIARATQGLGGPGTGSPDPDIGWDFTEMAKKGLTRGAYHFLDPTLDGAKQADYFLKTLNGHGVTATDMLWLDNETTGGLPPRKVAACAKAFMTELDKQAPDNPRGVYTFINFALAGNCNGLGGWPLWLAYPNRTAPQPPPPWANWTFWQWGQRNGVDTDAFNGTATDLADWIASYAPVLPSHPTRHHADGVTSLAGVCTRRGVRLEAAIWQTAHDAERGFNPVQRRYFDHGDMARHMPLGMPYSLPAGGK